LFGAGGLALLLMSNAVAADLGTMSAGADWSGHGGGPDAAGYSQLGEISTSNIGKLGLVSSLDLEGEVSLEATPLAVDGILYFTGTYSAVYAVEAKTGKLLWKFDPKIWKFNPRKMRFTFAINRGAAYAKGRVFAAALDGRLFALDAKTGKVLWTMETVPKDTPHTSTGAPLVFNDKVIIGNGGAEIGVRGYVTAYDQATGKQAWRFYTVPGSPEENKGDPAMEKAAETWKGEWWKRGGGGTVWNGMTFDPEMNRIYLGVGNAGPWDPEVRSPGGGDSLYTSSIVALDANTGKYIWHYQETPREEWDYKATPNITMATIPVEGKPRKVLLHAPTNGFFYVIDRETGKFISAGKTGKVTWADKIDPKTGRPVENKHARYEFGETVEVWPGGIGGHNWMDMSFNPNTGLAYLPYMQVGMRYMKGKTVLGATKVFDITIQPVLKDKHDGKGALIAWDPVKQKPRWQIWHDTIWNGGTLSTAGGLVFQGTADGYFTAYDAANGKRLWRFNASHGIIAAPISYSVEGKQYVTVLGGYGGSVGSFGKITNAGWKYGAQPRRVLTFTLDGKAVLPQTAPADFTVHAVDDPSLQLDEKEVEAGHAIASRCGGCHGQNLEATGAPGPDLRESAAALDFDELWKIVHEGTRADRGMPLHQELTKEQAHQIWSYIRAGARESLGLRPPSANVALPPKL
jgi:quinohemoprotein ethanol dehydrogenase